MASAPDRARRAPWAASLAQQTGELLSAGGALALIASLWAPWFVLALPCAVPLARAPCPPTTIHYSAWDAFHVVDVALAVLAVVVLALNVAGPGLAARLAPTLGVSAAFGILIARLSVAACGWLAVALSVYGIFRPALAVDPGRAPDIGFFVALVAAGAVIGGGWWSIVVGARALPTP